MSPFLDALSSGRVLLMDGAMGTELQRAGLKLGENAAAWNVFYPERVRAVHQAYRDAGARVLLTNTFLINDRSFCRAMWLADRSCSTSDSWQPSYELIGTGAYRIAAIGPVAGEASAREFDNLKLLDVGECNNGAPHASIHFPHAILLETCSSPRVRYAIRMLRRWHASRPFLLSLTYLRNEVGNLVTFSGHSPEWFAHRAKEYGVAALGVNCGRDISMSDCAEIVRRYRRVTDLPLFARPNAGTPRMVRSRWVYPLTPQAMAERVPELLEAGLSMVGGCCGTTPEHIAALRPVVARWNRRR
jgi:methionine synthase I (cobalamin-dependent)